ncbi:hypothetical protein [Membranihabitans maritimus]|uniref:hypothetical protein n=1 Tax=Membranihabitans maritimus TaxID=2904244 RepID=UPI001F1C5DDC|nr:hypothetical protein [Membranihabitans maritimus]
MNIRLLIPLIGVLIFASCEKRDVLGEQGDLTGKDYPFLTLASIPDSRPMDTVSVVATFWAVEDDISHVKIIQEGYKVGDLSLNWVLNYTTDSIQVEKKLELFQPGDTLFYPESIIVDIENQGNSLDTFYQTVETSYIINKEWVIPEQYQVNVWEGEDVIDALDPLVLSEVKSYFANQLNATDALFLFPDSDSSFFEIDNMGGFSGNLTETGKDSIRSWTTLEVLKTYLASGEMIETSEININAEISNQKEISVKDESTFEILN